MYTLIKSIILFSFLSFSGCVTVRNSIDFEKHYNSIIGTEIEPAMMYRSMDGTKLVMIMKCMKWRRFTKVVAQLL